MSLPILLVPGLNCSARLYSQQIPELWRCGPVMVADHKRGLSVAEIAGRVLASAPRFFALVGFSLGGYIALEIMRQAAERVERLVLADTSARADTPEQIESRRERLKMAREGCFSESIARQYPLSTHPSRHNDEKLRDAYFRMADECGPDVFIRHLNAAISRPDSRGDLSRIGCPTLVIVGDSDGVTPPALAREMSDGIPGARLKIISEAGHLTPLERPEALTQALLEFIDVASR
jgi:pimeloyl-ACP methyl ester carboxylesterase